MGYMTMRLHKYTQTLSNYSQPSLQRQCLLPNNVTLN